MFYVGGLSRNGITTSFLNLMEYMKDQGTEYNYYAAFQEEYFKDTPERVGILPEFVDILPMSKGWNLTFLEALACYIYYKGNIDNFIVQRYLKRLLQPGIPAEFWMGRICLVHSLHRIRAEDHRAFRLCPRKKSYFFT